MKELYINSVLVDLKPSEPIATSYKVNKIAEIKDVQAYFSNRFTLPFTDVNKKAFGMANDLGATTNLPYRVLPCRIIEDGVDLIEDAVAILVSYNDGFEVEVYSGLFDFFSQIEGLKLTDLNYDDLNFVFTVTNVVGLSGDVVYPLVNYGTNDDGFTDTIDIRYQSPAIKVGYILNKIFEQTDWGKSGEIFSLDKFTDLYMLLLEDPVSDSDELLTSRSFNLGCDDFSFNSVVGFNRYYKSLIGLSSFYKTSDVGEYDSTAGCLIQVSSDIWSYQAVADSIIDISLNLWFIYNSFDVIEIYKNGFPLYDTGFTQHINWYGNIVGQKIFTNVGDDYDLTSGHYEKTFSAIRLKSGDRLYITTRSAGGGPAVFYADGTNYGEPSNKSYIEFKAVNTSVVNSTIDFKTLISDMSQIDFIRNICNIFGIIMQPDTINRQIQFKQFRRIRENNEIVDWSNKLDLSIKEIISFHPDGFYQTNWMRWIQNDSRGNIGDGNFIIDDQTLEKEGNIVELDFASSLPQPNILSNETGITVERYSLKDIQVFQSTETYNNGDLVVYNGIYYENIKTSGDTLPGYTPKYYPEIWHVYTQQYEFKTSSDPRLVYVRNISVDIDIIDGENTVTVDNWNMAWFSDALQPYNLDFNWLITNEWYTVVDMLQRYKEVIVYLSLNGVDISSLDFFKMVYIEYFGDKFYLDSVDEYTGESSTKCTLIRL